ncbi:hypothetical protein [Pseudanabaena sp. FACHB-2040]|uniref:hypothetical protein n=1 Tax=Pseudanabaena sp. FACHB-2040 TaxID=2692859 RepID=UPI001686648E|nr:hypothetical protein [Pseudanabaena sp. FACHB-2040]MBD2256750.1 hypothetical protein [Pseudanabaena sp. FACHB-2040]
MKIILTVTAIGLVTVMGVAGAATAATAQPSAGSRCDDVNFIETSSSECIDLTRLTSTLEIELSTQFYTALGRLSIPVLHKDCESDKTLGYYDLSSNEMVLCMNNLQDDHVEIEATLIHESWHVVQDCEDGLDNASYRPMSLRHGDSANLDLMASSLQRADLRTIENHYNPEDRPHEIEARYMEHHPDLVLQALNACAIRQ